MDHIDRLQEIARAAWIAAAFVAADGFFIAYSRSALLDGMIVGFGVAAVTIILRSRTFWHVLAAGVPAGCAVSCKLNGLAFVGTATAVCLPRHESSNAPFPFFSGLWSWCSTRNAPSR